MSNTIKLLLLLFIPIPLNGQNEYTVTIEDKILMSPSKFSVKFNCVSSEIFNNSWVQGEKYLSKDSLMQILNSIEDVKIVNQKDSVDLVISEYLDVLYAEIIGIKSFQKLKKDLAFKAPFMVEKYHVDDFEEQENKLIIKMVNEARQTAKEELYKLGKEIGEILNYEEVDEPNQTTEVDGTENSGSGFSMLKEKFIEANFKGYLINKKGQVVLRKKMHVNFRTK